MMADVSSLRNLGPKTRQRLETVGICDAETLCRLGPAEAYRRLKAAFPQAISLNALWALAGAVEGRHWQSYSPAEKEALKADVARD